jgi:hypothetical protein
VLGKVLAELTIYSKKNMPVLSLLKKEQQINGKGINEQKYENSPERKR